MRGRRAICATARSWASSSPCGATRTWRCPSAPAPSQRQESGRGPGLARGLGTPRAHSRRFFLVDYGIELLEKEIAERNLHVQLSRTPCSCQLRRTCSPRSLWITRHTKAIYDEVFDRQWVSADLGMNTTESGCPPPPAAPQCQRHQRVFVVLFERSCRRQRAGIQPAHVLSRPRLLGRACANH